MQATAKMTGAAFDALPYEGHERLELFEGECVEMPSTTPDHQDIVRRISRSLDDYLQEEIGNVYADVEFAMGNNIRLRPDIAVIVGENWLKLDRRRVPIPIPPAIAIEVISPSERRTYSANKVHIYLRQVQEVWQVLPEEHSVLLYTQAGELTILGENDQLQSTLLPGWTLSIPQALGLTRRDPPRAAPQ